MFGGKERTGSSESGLNFIEDQHDAVPVANLAQTVQKCGRCGDEAAFAEDRLDDDRRDAVRRDAAFEERVERR